MDTSLLLSIIMMMVAAFVISLVVRRVDQRFQTPLHSGALPATQFPNPKRLHVASMLLIGTYVAFGAWLVTLLLGFIGVFRNTMPIRFLIFTVMALGLTYFVLALWVRCPSCNRHVLIQWTTAPPFAAPKYGFAGWITIAARVVCRRQFRCMYCGRPYVP